VRLAAVNWLGKFYLNLVACGSLMSASRGRMFCKGFWMGELPNITQLQAVLEIVKPDLQEQLMPFDGIQPVANTFELTFPRQLRHSHREVFGPWLFLRYSNID